MGTSRNDPRVVAAVEKAMEIAYSKVGTIGGNWVWNAVHPPFVGQAWCGAFIVWIYRMVGVDLMRNAWWYYIPYVRNFAARQGFLRHESGYGFLPLFDWHGDGIMDHIGASNPDPHSAQFRGIEGNTSSGNAGSQDNGNGVWERYRDGDDIPVWVDMYSVLAWMIDTGKWDGRVTNNPLPTEDAALGYNDLNPNGYDAEYIGHIQSRLVHHGYDIGSSGVDKILGWKTYSAIGRFQRDKGLDVDHIPGPLTRRWLDAEPGTTPSARYANITKIQKALHATPDNVVGGETRGHLDALRAASNWGGETFPYGIPYTQRVVGTTPDGIWGNNSRTCHDRTVGDLQRALVDLGYSLSVDEIYGQRTNAAAWDAINRADQV